MKSNICDLGGTERVTVVLANALVKTYDCCIITLSQSTIIPYKLDKNIKLFKFGNKTITNNAQISIINVIACAI